VKAMQVVPAVPMWATVAIAGSVAAGVEAAWEAAQLVTVLAQSSAAAAADSEVVWEAIEAAAVAARAMAASASAAQVAASLA